MRRDAMRDARAAAAPARNIQELDASLDLPSGVGAGGSWPEDPARSLVPLHDLAGDRQSRPLRKRIIAVTLTMPEVH